MARTNPSSAQKELAKLIKNYEAAKAENRQLYLDADQLADIADWYVGEKKLVKAQEVIDYGLNLHPRNTDLLIEQAYLYLDAQNLEKAKKIAATINEEYAPEVKMLKAELLLNEGKLEEAKQELTTILNIDDLITLTDIVYLFLDLGYPESAWEWLEKGKSKYAEEQDFQALMADYLFATHQHEAAIEAYNKLIDKDPYNASYWMGLVKIHFIKENIDKTIEACDFALAADDRCGEAYVYKAHGFFYLGNSEEAIKYYQKAIDYKSISPELGYMFIGLSYTNKDEWQKADDYYTKVIECFEKEGDIESILLADTYTNKALAVSHLGRFEEAHLLCETAKKLAPDEDFIFLTEGKIYLKEGLEDQASASFKKALELNPEVEMCYIIASTYSGSDYLYEAKEYYEMVYKLDPKYEQVTEKLSVLNLMINEVEDFFKYNNESENPIGEDVIQDLLSNQEREEEDKKTFEEILKRMEKERKKKEK